MSLCKVQKGLLLIALFEAFSTGTAQGASQAYGILCFHSAEVRWKSNTATKLYEQSKEGLSFPCLLTLYVLFFMPQIPSLQASLVAQWLRIHLPMQGTWV